MVEATPYRGAIVRWLSRNEIAEQGFLVDAIEMPAYQIVVERITDAELATIDERGKGSRARAARARRASLRRARRPDPPAALRVHRVPAAPRSHPDRRRAGRPALRQGPGLSLRCIVGALLALALARIDAVRARDAEGVRETVAEHRQRLQALNEISLADPNIARYFKDA